jgi:hypothetical protein
LFSAVCEWRTKVQSLEVVHIEDVPVEEVWAHLSKDAGSVLIDVRTRAEWTFVGLPDLSEIGKRVLTVEWQTCPERALLKTANCFSSVDPARAVAWQRKPWRTSAIDDAEMWRTVSRGLSTPIAIEGRSPVGRRPV